MKVTNSVNSIGGGLKTLFIDVMLKGRFIRTLRYRYSPLFPITEEDIHSFVVQHIPYLEGKPFNVVW